MKRQGRLSRKLVHKFAAELVVALGYLREMRILHRDLKPGNIVLDKDYHMKLIDFGSSKVFNEEIQTQINTFMSKSTQGVV